MRISAERNRKRAVEDRLKLLGNVPGFLLSRAESACDTAQAF